MSINAHRRIYQIRIYHNTDSRYFPYQPGHALTQVISHWRDLPATVAPEQTANWIYSLFNVDLDQLETGRTTPDGEADFLIACVCRLLRLRSLSTGDVIAITTDGQTTWLACEFIGWRPIEPPANITDQPLISETVYQHLRPGRHA